MIGQVGLDPGTEWGSGNQSTADNTIRRMSTVCGGDTNGGDAFVPSAQWDGFANDTFGGLGTHTASCGGPPTQRLARGQPLHVSPGGYACSRHGTPGGTPTSTNLMVSGDLTLIGGSPTQQFFDDAHERRRDARRQRLLLPGHGGLRHDRGDQEPDRDHHRRGGPRRKRHHHPSGSLRSPAGLLLGVRGGTSNNKGVEIFNATASTIDLGANGYDVQIYFNGSASAGTTVALVGSIVSGGTFVLSHSSATFPADQENAGITFNGDDALVLRKGGVIIDVIGQIGFDPGTEWGTGDASMQDNTIRRKPPLCKAPPAGTTWSWCHP